MMATGMDGPLDFEVEDFLVQSPAPAKKRNKVKVIDLDDLLSDHFKEKETLKDKGSKKAKHERSYNSDDEEDSRVAKLSECVEKCEKEMGQISGDDEIYTWGLQFFGNQKSPPPLVFSELGSCGILQSFMTNKLNSLLELKIEKGEAFFERLLVNGWLIKLVLDCGHVEKSIALWTFGKMLYSSDQELSASACDFWCELLSSGNKIRIDWLPRFSEIKIALEVYGFLLDSTDNSLSDGVVTDADSYCGQAPQSIRAWINYLAACFRVRIAYPIFSTSEVEELLVVICCLFLDRQLLGLCVILCECMLSAVSFFTDSEWSISCEKVANSLAHRIPRDMNCLRIVESIPAVDARSKHLRRTVAFHMLIACFDNKASDSEEIMRLLVSINVKDKSSDLFKTYILLILTENWLLCNPLPDKPVINEMWGVYLRNCSCQITTTDLRPYASKVRSKASYILQGSST